MSKYGQPHAFLLVGGCDLRGEPTWGLTETVEQILERSDGIGDTWEEHLPVGIARVMLEAPGGIYDDTTGLMLTAYQEKGSTEQEVCYGFDGEDIGDDCVMLAGTYASTWKRISARDGLTKGEATFTVTGEYLRGRVIHGIDNESGDGDTESTPVDQNDNRRVPAQAITSSAVSNPCQVTCPEAHGLITGDEVVIAGHSGSTPDINGQQTVTYVSATVFSLDGVNCTVGGTGGTFKKVTSTGCKCHLHVPELTLGGYTDCVVTVLDSDDDVTYSTLETFTAVTVENTAETKTVSGEVQRYLAISWAFTGSGSGPTITPFVAVSR